MKRLVSILVLVGVAGPGAAFARSKHAGWHNAAPVKRLSPSKTSRINQAIVPVKPQARS